MNHREKGVQLTYVSREGLTKNLTFEPACGTSQALSCPERASSKIWRQQWAWIREAREEAGAADIE